MQSNKKLLPLFIIFSILFILFAITKMTYDFLTEVQCRQDDKYIYINSNKGGVRITHLIYYDKKYIRRPCYASLKQDVLFIDSGYLKINKNKMSEMNWVDEIGETCKYTSDNAEFKVVYQNFNIAKY